MLLVWFYICAWLCRANAFGAYSGGRMLCAPTSFLWAVGAAISRPKTFLFRANSPYQGELSSAADKGDRDLPLPSSKIRRAGL